MYTTEVQKRRIEKRFDIGGFECEVRVRERLLTNQEYW